MTVPVVPYPKLGGLGKTLDLHIDIPALTRDPCVGEFPAQPFHLRRV